MRCSPANAHAAGDHQCRRADEPDQQHFSGVIAGRFLEEVSAGQQQQERHSPGEQRGNQFPSFGDAPPATIDAAQFRDHAIEDDGGGAREQIIIGSLLPRCKPRGDV